MSPPSSNNEGNDAWLMKIEMKREEPEEINKDDGIKEAMEDQAPAAEDEDILQPHHNLLTPTEIEAFKMIELARIQNKYLTRENILLKEHITALKGLSANWRVSYARCVTLNHQQLRHHHPRKERHNHMGMGTPLGNCQAWGSAPVSYNHRFYLYRFP